jgi:hypothetical protein
MNLSDIESLMRLMNTYGITNLSLDKIVLTCPTPRIPITQQIMTVTPEEISELELPPYDPQPTPKPKKKTQQELDDDLLFYHEKYQADGDI